MAAAELCERGLEVELLSPLPPERWPMLPEAGITVGADPERSYRETIACGGWLAARAPVRAMTRAAHGLVDELERWGVPFARHDGARALRRLPGASHADAAFVECRTGELCVRALAGRLRKYRVQVREPYELVALVRDDAGRCIGAVAQNLVTTKMRLVAADALVLASGGPEKLFCGGGALSVESAAIVALEAGGLGCNVDCVGLHPAALRVGPRVRLLSSAMRSESGRFWAPEDETEVRPPREVPKRERDRFLDRAHPGWGALAPDDLCARAVAKRTRVYLDVSHLPEAHLRDKLETEIDACALYTGVDPTSAPLEVKAAAAGCLGGLWVDHERAADGGLAEDSPRNHRTSIEGLYAVGECAALYHGSCRLGGNGLLAAAFGARIAARAIAGFLEGAPEASPPPKAALRAAKKRYQKLAAPDAEQSAAALHERLRLLVDTELGVRAEETEETEATESIDDIRESAARLSGDPRAVRDAHRMLVFTQAFLASRRERSREEAPRSITLRLSESSAAIADTPLVDHEDLAPEPRRYAEEEG
jgi:succinate dehydrogenase / fumarate reductase flavoprotein subunit